MKLLVDTHAALWWLAGDDRFGDEASRQLVDQRSQVLLSAAVVWEIATKRSLGKLELPGAGVQALLDAGAQALPISLEHAAAVERLPPHHRDPFARMLVAQAIVEGAAIVSRDAALQPYGVPLVW